MVRNASNISWQITPCMYTCARQFCTVFRLLEDSSMTGRNMSQNSSTWYMDGRRSQWPRGLKAWVRGRSLNLYAPYILYIGQTDRSSPQYTFYIFSQQIYLNTFLDFLSPSSFIPPQNVVYFLMLPFLVHKIFTFYITGVLNCKCPAPGPKG